MIPHGRVRGSLARAKRAGTAAVAMTAIWLLPVSARAQAVPPLVIPQEGPAAELPDSLVPRGVTPAGAFLRSVLVPGWGHASIGSTNRAGFYFVLETTSIYGLLRTLDRIDDVRRRAEFREGALRDDLAARGITDPVEVQSALEDDATLEDLRNLEEARIQQREDWAAFGIFLLFLSGADAFVSAHLKDFPTPIDIAAAPLGDGRMELAVSIKLGN